MLCLAIMGARTTYHVLLTWAKGRENILQASAGLLTVGYFVHMLLVIIWLHPFEYTYYTQEILKYGVDHIVNNIDEMEPVFIEKRGKNQIMGIYRRKNVPVETGQ